MTPKQKKKLSKFLSHCLRHNQIKYGVEKLDANGYADLATVATGLGTTIQNIEVIVQECPKGRFEINGSKIRALFGHSDKMNIDLNLPVVNPPRILYHACHPDVVDSIKSEGLTSRGRMFVHLSDDANIALKNAERKTDRPALLEVSANEHFHEGGAEYFNPGGNSTWVVSYVPFSFIKIT